MHTPGPWKIKTYSDNQIRDARGVFSAGDALIVPYAYGDDLPQSDANAKLIATAPEMLACLREYVAEWNATHENENHRSGLTPKPASYLWATDLIAKATE